MQYDKTIFSQNGVACNVQFYKHLWLDVVTSPDGSAIEVITVRLTSAQARELAAMLLQAANVADGLPARPVAIGDVSLQYVTRADNRDSLSVILGDNPVEDDGWLASDYNAGIDGGTEGDSE